jgi:hypothetical protein
MTFLLSYNSLIKIKVYDLNLIKLLRDIFLGMGIFCIVNNFIWLNKFIFIISFIKGKFALLENYKINNFSIFFII